MKKKSMYLLFCFFSIFLCFGYSELEAVDYSIVFVHVGEEIPSYATTAFSQARAFNPDCPIFIIAHKQALHKLFSQGNDNSLTGIDYEKLNKTEAHRQFNKKSKLNRGFWLYTSERFLYLNDFMSQYALQNVFHLEYDNMLYVNLKELLPSFQSRYPGIAATFDNDERCIPGFVYVSNARSMQGLADCFARHASKGFNDMQILAQFKKESSDSRIDNLPIIMPEYINHQSLVSSMGHSVQKADKYFQNIDLFHSIFDAAALGQYLGGIDTIHQGGGIPGFINESCVFNASLLSYEWNTDDQGRSIPYAVYAGKSYRINNLHVHSKHLSNFSSFKKF